MGKRSRGGSGYFQGWYLKHEKEGQVLALIPAYHRDQQGKTSASLQVVTREKAYHMDYPAEDFDASGDRFHVWLGGNLFSENGIHLEAKSEGLTLKGSLEYGPFLELKSDIMGPFRYVPNLQCRHRVLSMAHPIDGRLELNGEILDFTGGRGYIEGDSGVSFPDAYLWTQCGWEDEGPCSLMLSIATVPCLGVRFTGCICAIQHKGKEYRLATYRGVRIHYFGKDFVLISQGRLSLQVDLLEERPMALKAPCFGSMSRRIDESPACRVRYRLRQGKELIFDLESSKAGFEYYNGRKGSIT